ncbi:MAG: VWA domain-containing protein [Microscillaceae bacterium]|nr:VWA domain-containing protein [Microscillaceae bacterium]MDW8460387.1 VWA domain-containing protein [Cytophagales bacterium]
MLHTQFILQSSPWLILLCLAIGALYAFLLYYSKSSPFRPKIRYFLASLRFVLVSIICFLLLLNPLMRQVKNSIEKPTVVFALDNSLSVANTTPPAQLKTILAELDQLRTALHQKDIATDIFYFNKKQPVSSLQNIAFQHPSSNLHQLLAEVQNNYENRNLDKVVFVSDGIFNQGFSPAFANYRFPVYCLALGDATPKKDLKVQSVLANKIAYLGNQFPINVEIENIGFTNRTVTCYLLQNGNTIDKKNINFAQESIQNLTFYATAQTKGMQRYTIQLQTLEGEFSTQNNVRDVYIEVLEAKEKILMVALTPHPDIKAIRSALEKNANYSFELHIPNINALKEDKYDVVIFHQIPNNQGIGNDLYNRFMQSNVPVFTIVGSQSSLPLISQNNKVVKILQRSGQLDKVIPYFNPKFNRFTFEANKINLISKYPPAQVPFGDYTLANNAEVLLYQQVGNVRTDKPLLVMGDNGKGTKQAFMLGEGLWQWRMEEFELTNSQETFDELVTKFIQLLSIKDDKRRLRVYPLNEEIYNFEKVVFETEVYNEIYEKVYDQKINLSLKDDKGKTSTYNYTISQGNTRFEISGLPQGVYSYTATTEMKGKVEVSSGQFVIKEMQLEALNTTADHNLLKTIAQNTQGQFFTAEQIEKLKQAVLATSKPNFIQSVEDLTEMINLKWIFFVLLALATLEWATRKHQGSY